MRDEAAEPYPRSAPLKFRLPLIQTLLQSPQPSGLQSPPLQASVSVPFRWEDEPGKPRFSSTTLFPHKTLDLPPRLLLLNAKTSKLDASLLGRDQGLLGKDFHGYAHRFSPQKGQLGDMVLSKRELKPRGWVGFSGRRPSKINRDVNSDLKINGHGKSSTLSHLDSRILGAIYSGLKQIVSWGKRK